MGLQLGEKTVTIKATVQSPESAEVIHKWKRCPYCQKSPTKEHMQELVEQYKPRILGYERIVIHMNELTNKAKNRKITWRRYTQQWKSLNRELNAEHSKWDMGYKFHPKEVHDYITEFCKKCGYGSSFTIIIFSDLEPQPMLPKYDKTVKTNCPKCGMLGVAYIDRRGYKYIQHYIKGKRKTCYIGK